MYLNVYAVDLCLVYFNRYSISFLTDRHDAMDSNRNCIYSQSILWQLKFHNSTTKEILTVLWKVRHHPKRGFFFLPLQTSMKRAMPTRKNSEDRELSTCDEYHWTKSHDVHPSTGKHSYTSTDRTLKVLEELGWKRSYPFKEEGLWTLM